MVFLNKEVHFDERRNIVIPGDEAATLQYCIQQFIDLANHAIQAHGSFAVALSGGSTPKAIYKGLASPENRNKIAWEKVLLFWSDERCVAKDHVGSNYKMAMDAAFSQLPLKPEHIYPMEGTGDLDKNAVEYERLIREKTALGKFDLVMLGLGEDGHTASLFPHTKGLQIEKREVIPNYVPEKKCWRMTLTFDCINTAEHTVLYALGASKAEVVKKVFFEKYNPEQLPAQRVGTKEHKALWILDEKAGAVFKGPDPYTQI